MAWIHCNSCFKQPAYGSSVTFLLTSCGHFYCSLCIKPGENKKCVKCGNDFSTTELTTQMRPDVQEYFQDPVEIVKKLSQTMVFQNNHRIDLSAHFQQINAKYQAAKIEMKKMFDSNKSLKKRNAELEMAVKHYQKKLSCVNITPVHGKSSASSTPYGSISVPPSPAHSQISGQGFSSQASQGVQLGLSQSNVWLTPDRLTLQFNKSMSSNGPPVEPSPNASRVMSTPQNCSQRSDRDLFVTPSPLRHHSQTMPVVHGAYRSGPPQYSTQPNTPQNVTRRSPATPGMPYNLSQSSITSSRSQSPAGSYRRSALPTRVIGHPSYGSGPSITPPTSAFSYIDLYSQRCRSGQQK